MDEGESVRPQRAGRFQDARGKSVTLLDPYLLHKLRRHDVIPAEPLADIARAVGSGWVKAGRMIFTTVWPVVLVCLVIAHVAKWGGGLAVHPRELRLWIVLLVCFATNVALVWFFSRSGRLQRVCKVMLKHLRCPHCGYDIRGLPTDATDKATICPECGCAWHLRSRTE
ncbi:MAG: hypothetical protein JSV19_00505 [Phycisphaerales bacterium]|nr:MAG: hypothetical protein JSV19_00505 [Phycisphaerales bacterium]